MLIHTARAPALSFVLLSLLLWACPAPTEPDPVPLSGCADTNSLIEGRARLSQWFDDISEGVNRTPAPVVLAEDTNGTLEIGLLPDLLPLLVGSGGVHAAATRLGEGRIVAFSGQDFLSSTTRSTLLGGNDIQHLLRNSLAWAGGSTTTPLKVLADNDAVAAVLEDGTAHTVDVAPIVEVFGLREIRDWSSAALEDVDVLVVQVNEWGTLHVSDDDIDDIRAFVQAGGGLLIAGSALHWSWWLWDQGPAFPGDAILEDAGIAWSRSSFRDLTDARLSFDEPATPESLWCAYVAGDPIDDEDLPLVAPLFQAAADAQRNDEVDQALERLLNETPRLPVSVDNGAARLSADVGAKLRAYTWPEAHKWVSTFPGDASDGATRRELTRRVDTNQKRMRPLAAYAPAGEAITITVPSDHAASGLSIRMGELYDDLRNLDHISEWRRAPLLVQDYPINDTTISIGNGFGGALYLVVPDDHPGLSFDLQISGALTMAVYSEGLTTAGEFSQDLKAGAPQAILQQEGKVAMVVPSSAASEVTTPSDVISFWAAFYDSHADLAQEPAARPYESHWIFDPQVGWGYANATGRRITFPELAVGWALRTQSGDEDWWLFGHELGHQFQTSDWSSGDITEVAVNLFTMYTLNAYINGGGNYESRGHQNNQMDHMSLVDARWNSADLFGKLEMYRQLVFEFGWDAYRQSFASYYDPAYPRADYGSYMDGFALRFSAITGRDLTPFFDHWQYPMSADTRSEIQSWSLPQWLPPGW